MDTAEPNPAQSAAASSTPNPAPQPRQTRDTVEWVVIGAALVGTIAAVVHASLAVATYMTGP